MGGPYYYTEYTEVSSKSNSKPNTYTNKKMEAWNARSSIQGLSDNTPWHDTLPFSLIISILASMVTYGYKGFT